MTPTGWNSEEIRHELSAHQADHPDQTPAESASGTPASPVDPEARHARKTVTRRQDGFKPHVVVDPDAGLVIGCALTSANGSSGPGGAKGLRLLDATRPFTAPCGLPEDSADAVEPATPSPPPHPGSPNRELGCRVVRRALRTSTQATIRSSDGAANFWRSPRLGTNR